MSKRDLNWIIKIGEKYLKHPRGEFTKIASDAYGYHYKKECKIEMGNWVNFPETNHGVNIDSLGGINEITCMRRNEALDL